MKSQTTVKLDTFTQAYIECALWSSINDDGEPLDRDYGISDLSQEALDSMIADCADFQTSFAELLEKSGQSPEQSGHDFWLTRNRHGAGFWDRGLGDIGEELTKMCRPYGECNLYVGDDGRIYL